MTQMQRLVVPARKGRAIRLKKGQRAKLINIHGTQVIDTWAFGARNPAEHMSMEHSRRSIGRIRPQAGDTLVTNLRRPILEFEEDTSPGIHDTLLAACDRYSYEMVGVQNYHDNCTDNLQFAMRDFGFANFGTPCPLNLWMNIPVHEDHTSISLEGPVAKPRDYVTLRALMDCILVMSSCPNDVHTINGSDRTPKEIEVEVFI